MTSLRRSSARQHASVMTSYSSSLHGVLILTFCQASLAGVDEMCLSPLGFEFSNHGSAFHASVSHGNDKDVRLNSPRAWRLTSPSAENNLLLINSTRTILLTGLQIQGHEEGQGWMTGWQLETSTDCRHFDKQSYQMTVPSQSDSKVVRLKAVTLASCVRLMPTHLHGARPALRLELLGCLVTPPAPSSSLRRLADGGWQLTSEEERLVSWLQLTTATDVTARLTLAYSRDCEMWRFVDSGGRSQHSVLTPDTKSRRVTVTLASPVYARCLRIYSIEPTTVSDVDTNINIRTPNRVEKNEGHSMNEEHLMTEDSLTDENPLTNEEDPSMNRLSTHKDSAPQADQPLLLAAEALALTSEGQSLDEVNKPTNTSGNATQDDDQNDVNQESMNTETKDASDIFTEELHPEKNTKYSLGDAPDTSAQPNDKTGKLAEGEIPTDKKSSLKIIYFDDNTADGENQSSDDTNNGPAHGTQCGVRTVRNRAWQRRRRKRVVSGHRNLNGEWPWLVSLHYLPPIEFTEASGYKHICGASLITDDWLLTAGHCFSNDTLPGLETVSNWEVHLGLNDLAKVSEEPSAQKRGVEGFVRHPRYDRYSDTPTNYDIALIKLSSPVSFSPSVSPICLEEENFTVSHDNCAVSGWGKPTYNGTGTRHGHTAPKTLMSQADCNATYDRLDEKHPFKKYVNIMPDVMCAEVGPNGEDSCLGDSGSPLMCEEEGRWYQVGVVAAGYECGHAHFPGIYSRVAYFTDWIRETMANYESGDQWRDPS